MVEEESIKGVTVEELFKMYYEERRNDKSISAQTSSYDLSNWNRFFADSEIAKSKIVDLTSVIILRDYKRIVQRGDITKKAFNKASGLLNGMFDIAIEKGIIDANVARNTPTSKLTFRPESDNTEMVYRPEEREALIKYLKSIPQTRYTLACRLMACLPLRMGEIRALTWADYNERKKSCISATKLLKSGETGKNVVM